jgi:VanZ family protein
MDLYDGLIEFIQPVVNRYGELNDFLANCTGVIIGGGAEVRLKR